MLSNTLDNWIATLIPGRDGKDTYVRHCVPGGRSLRVGELVLRRCWPCAWLLTTAGLSLCFHRETRGTLVASLPRTASARVYSPPVFFSAHRLIPTLSTPLDLNTLQVQQRSAGTRAHRGGDHHVVRQGEGDPRLGGERAGGDCASDDRWRRARPVPRSPRALPARRSAAHHELPLPRRLRRSRVLLTRDGDARRVLEGPLPRAGDDLAREPREPTDHAGLRVLR